MEEMNQQQKQKNGYWGGLLSGLLLAILLMGAGFIIRQTYDIFQAKKIASLPKKESDRELLDEYTSSKVEVIEDTIRNY